MESPVPMRDVAPLFPCSMPDPPAPDDCFVDFGQGIEALPEIFLAMTW
jgi:hypothetical protein